MIIGHIKHDFGHDGVTHAVSRVLHHADEVGRESFMHQQIDAHGEARDVVGPRGIAANKHRATAIAEAIAHRG